MMMDAVQKIPLRDRFAVDCVNYEKHFTVKEKEEAPELIKKSQTNPKRWPMEEDDLDDDLDDDLN